ncbi:MAG: hypothetical protein OEW59_08585, partial [Gammaproteobacteria bacterium]|nr:hypothetical protein [Gammaproteobacteria bacterium]
MFQDLSDRALKERVVGAVVLVLLAVLVVPIFLDGPSSDAEIISESVTLPGQNSQERKQQTIVLDRDRSQPVPVANVPAPPVEEPDPDPEPEPEAPVAARPAVEREAPPPAATAVRDDAPATTAATSGTGMWAVQLGSFENRENAEKL